MAGQIVPAHQQTVTLRFIVAYPDHEPRQGDPNYVDFEAWKNKQRNTPAWRCHWAVRIDDDSDCDLTTPLQAHHGEIEFALLNAIDFKHLEVAYPGISDPNTVGAWVESGANLRLLCRKHHLGLGSGVHKLDAAMYEASHFLTPGVLMPWQPKP